MAQHDAVYVGPRSARDAYRVDESITVSGGCDDVFVAERTTWSGDPVGYEGSVSLKVLLDADAELESKLRSRSEALRRQPHPHLARPLEVFRAPGLRSRPPRDDGDGDDDLLWVTAEWVEGVALRRVAPLDPDDALRVVADVADAVGHLHEACGFVHRDLHPGNVIVTGEGRGVVIDLGAARPDDGEATTTVAGVIGFIAPERTHGHCDRRSDVWGVGMLAVHALLGRPQGRQPAGELRAELAGVLPPRLGRQVVDHVIAMVDPEPGRRPTDLRGWAGDLRRAAAPPPQRRRRRAPWTAVAAAVPVALAAAALGTAITDDDPPPPPQCAFAIGEPAPELGRSEAARVRLALDELRAAADVPCAAGPAARFGDAVVQPVGDGDRPDQLVVSPDGDTVRLTFAQWTSYSEILGRGTPENATISGGYPTRVGTGPLDGVMIDLSVSGMLLGRRDDTQSFWMPDEVLARWDPEELGFPTTNPYADGGRFRQDFQYGYLSTPSLALVAELGPDAAIEVHDPDPGELLGDVAPLDDRIIRQVTGTAWWVDDGVRHWIPDGGTWTCLGGDDAVAHNDLRGYAVAALPLGPPAACPD